MTSNEAAQILGVDNDTIEDLEDVLGLDGGWTIADLEHAAEILDDDREDDEFDEDDQD